MIKRMPAYLFLLLILFLAAACARNRTIIWEEYYAPDASKPFHSVPYDVAPVPINPTPPTYTPYALDNNIQGTVTLVVDVRKTGAIRYIRVYKTLLAGQGGLDEQAINTVKTWKFKPVNPLIPLSSSRWNSRSSRLRVSELAIDFTLRRRGWISAKILITTHRIK